MRASNLSVTISLSHATYCESLPEALARRGLLRRAVRFGMEVEVFEHDSNGGCVGVTKMPSFRLVNRLQEQCKRTPLLRRWPALPLLPAMMADRWIARQMKEAWLPPSDVFHAMHMAAFGLLGVARQLGTHTVLDHPSLHPESYQREILAECEAMGLPPRASNRLLSTAHIRRLVDEFKACDRIAVLSSAAQRSFRQFSYGDKAVVVLPGTDHHFFNPGES